MEKRKNQNKSMSTTKSNSRVRRYRYAKPSKQIVLNKNASEYSVNFTLKPGGRRSALEKSIGRYIDAHKNPKVTPFIFGRPATGTDFLNYKPEIDWIIKELNNGQYLIILFGGDGFGKTSLAMALEERLEMEFEDSVTGYVSFREAKSEWDLLKRYVEAMFRALGIPDYRWGVINETNYTNQIPEIFDKPRAIAKSMGKNLIAIVDDFDAIRKLPHPDSIEAKFRSVWQRDSMSERNISAIVFNRINIDTLNINNKFRYRGVMQFFKNIDVNLWVDYLQHRFQLVDKSISKDVVYYLVQRMNDVPKKIQLLCHHLSLTQNKTISKQLVDKVIDQLITEKYWMFEIQLAQLTELQQRVLFTYAEKIKIDIPFQHHAKTVMCLDEFVYHTYENSKPFRDPFLEAYILKRNSARKRKWSEFNKKKKSNKGSFDDSEWTWK